VAESGRTPRGGGLGSAAVTSAGPFFTLARARPPAATSRCGRSTCCRSAQIGSAPC